MSAKFTVLIVGAGRIGAFFDTPDSVDVLTHAHAFSQHPDFELLGFVDQDLARAEQAARLWSVEAYASIDEAFASARIDVVVNATPDQVHFDTLQQLIDKAPRLIFTEKPLTATLSEAKQVLAQAQSKELEIAVNYSRCFVPEFVQLRKDIMQGLHGDYLTGSGAYGKGFLHNGFTFRQGHILVQKANCCVIWLRN